MAEVSAPWADRALAASSATLHCNVREPPISCARDGTVTRSVTAPNALSAASVAVVLARAAVTRVAVVGQPHIASSNDTEAWPGRWSHQSVTAAMTCSCSSRNCGSSVVISKCRDAAPSSGSVEASSSSTLAASPSPARCGAPAPSGPSNAKEEDAPAAPPPPAASAVSASASRAIKSASDGSASWAVASASASRTNGGRASRKTAHAASKRRRDMSTYAFFSSARRPCAEAASNASSFSI